MTARNTVAVPAHERRDEPWRQSVRGGSQEDRTLATITVSIPPAIAGLDPSLPSTLLAECDLAVRNIARLDQAAGQVLRPLATLLLRAESVASSKIEHEEAGIDDFARALHGVKANASATSMVAAAGAMDGLLHGRAGDPIEIAAIQQAHQRLMTDDPAESRYAGRWRDMQNWIGGSDFSPRNALYVPPPAHLIPDLMDDLVDFANRSDLPVIAQAAITHAQFESIHPFTDGNGRIGRALAAAVIRQRQAARDVVVPIASALVARREDYFAALDGYRTGNAGPIIAAFASSAGIAAEEAGVSADRLAAMPEQWTARAGRPRIGSATAGLLDLLVSMPVLTADDVEQRLKLSPAATYRAIDRLAAAEVIRPLTTRTRNQIYGVTDLLAELDDLGARIATRASGLSRSW